ncbi:hypothetical protein [Candidatus Burkholderia verschuerenii]|uniref:hypothetical protein n=1 Tax=Candidatus Burkholderia verschuerenii TaxID=242163 RepID=UPI000AF9318D|nr:hypothetical protein [Candidatus Burkholderia verschuerenii]
MRLERSFGVLAAGTALAILAGCNKELRSTDYFAAHECRRPLGRRGLHRRHAS